MVNEYFIKVNYLLKKLEKLEWKLFINISTIIYCNNKNFFRINIYRINYSKRAGFSNDTNFRF